MLVVENHPDTREGIRLCLELLGHQSISAGSMSEALPLAGRETFDLLLSDITLPDGDGWDLLRTLRARGQEPRQSIVMSGLNTPADQARSRKAGYQAHLAKPFSPLDLEKVLHRLAAEGAPSAVALASPGDRHRHLRQRLHDGLCQQLAASSLLQAALVNRLEALGKSSAASVDSLQGKVPSPGLASLPRIVEEAKRIGDLIHDALEETRAIMQAMDD